MEGKDGKGERREEDEKRRGGGRKRKKEGREEGREEKKCREGLHSLGKVGKKCDAFGLQADFFLSAVFGAFFCDRSELFDKGDIFDAVHNVGGSILRCVNKFSSDFFGKVGVYVRTFADSSAGGFDLIVEAIGAEVVGEVVRLFYFVRQGEAHPLFSVLSVVLVLSCEVVGKVEVSHFCCSFL